MQVNTGATTARSSNVRKITMLGLLSAIAYVVMFFGRIPIVSFLKYDPKDVIITIGGFLFGPLSAALVSLVVSVIEMVTVSGTGPIGLVMNVLSTCAFACTAAIIYTRRQNMKGAIVGLISGLLLMTGIMLLWNYLITPLYMLIPREDVAKMLIPTFLPFNLLKGGLNATLTMLLYKPLVRAMRRSHLLPEREGAAPETSGRINIGVTLVSAILLATCVLLILVINNII